MFYKPGLSMDLHKKQILIEALIHHNFNKMRTARDLNVSIRSIRNWVKEYNIQMPNGSMQIYSEPPPDLL